MTEFLVRTDPRDLPPQLKLWRFRREMEETSPEDRGKLLQSYLSDDSPVMRGALTLGTPDRVGTVAWNSPATLTEPEAEPTSGPLLKVREASALRSKTWRHGWDAKPPPKRTPYKRMDSMLQRYVKEWKAGNHALLAHLLTEASVESWKAGTPITVDHLQALAGKVMHEAEMRQKARA